MNCRWESQRPIREVVGLAVPQALEADRTKYLEIDKVCFRKQIVSILSHVQRSRVQSQTDKLNS